MRRYITMRADMEAKTEFAIDAAIADGLHELCKKHHSVMDLHNAIPVFRNDGMLVEALTNDTAHHKQWYLWQIAKKLGIDLSSQWDEEYPEPEKGIAP